MLPGETGGQGERRETAACLLWGLAAWTVDGTTATTTTTTTTTTMMMMSAPTNAPTHCPSAVLSPTVSVAAAGRRMEFPEYRVHVSQWASSAALSAAPQLLSGVS